MPAEKLRNNGTLMHNHHCDGCENGMRGGGGGGNAVDDTSSGGMLLQPLDDGQTSTMPVVVSYRPGAPTRTSIPLRTCYCQTNRNKTLKLVLTAAILVLGTTIGALIMYFSGSFQECGDSATGGM